MINTAKRTSLFVHGFDESVETEDVKMVTSALLEATDDNVLAVDYRDLADRLYTTSVFYVQPVAQAIANGLNSMIDAGLNPEKLYIIGHSLGAHVAGNIGRSLKVKIYRITALDAAGPLFYFVGSRLEPTDAKFVDAIHTDMGFYGTYLPVGIVNFYPNFGYRPQPGCSPWDIFSFCSHHVSYILYSESVRRPDIFVAVKCDGAISFKMGLCNNDTQTTLMGYGTPSDVTGSYYLTTTAEPPYGRGLQGARY